MKVKNRKKSDNDTVGRKKKQSRKSEPSINRNTSPNTKKNNIIIAFFLFSIFILALILRFAPFNNVFEGSDIIFPSFDVYYHLRLITYSAQNFPAFLWSDSYVNYPSGYNVGWMPLYDITIAFIARALSFGSPTIRMIETVAAIFPAVLGALTIFPVFFIGKELRDSNLGLLTAFLFAIMPAHLAVSKLGFTDHHVAEVFLFAMILLLLILSVKYGKNINLIYAAFAGIFMAGLVFTWSAALIYIAIINLFYFIQYGINLYKRKSSDNLIMTGAVAGFTTLIITVLLYLFQWVPLYQVLGIAAFFFSMTFTGILSNAMRKYGLHWSIYPVAIVLIGILMTGSIMLFPQEYSVFEEALRYLSSENAVATITETQPFAGDYTTFLTTLYFSIPFGFTLFFAMIGFFYYIIAESGSRYAPEKLLFFIPSLAIIILTFRQVRFSYMMSIFVAFYAAYFIHRMIFDENFSYNARSIASITFLILLIGVPTAYQAYAVATEPPNVAGDWRDSLTWMRNNTQATSYYDNPKETPEYGIMAWADYGNWIEYVARRPVVANNFQQGIDSASRYFTADSEKTANDILDQRRVRYVIVDDETGFGYKDEIYGKFGSILEIANSNGSGYYYTFDVPVPGSMGKTSLLNNSYYSTIYARLYLLDGSSMENPLNIRDNGLSHYRLVYESKTWGLNKIGQKKIKIFEYVPGAIIKGVTSPDTGLEVSVPVVTNANRTFDYVSKAVSDANGNFTMVVPYSTAGAPYETGPVNNYTLHINGASVKNISISNRQILDNSIDDLGYIGNPRTGAIQTAHDNPANMEILWKYDTGNKIFDMIIKNDMIYATSDKELFAIDINKSSLVWKQDTPGKPTFPEITEDTLFSAIQQTSFTKIYVRNIKTDKTSLINVPDIPASVSPILVDGNDLYMGTGNMINSYDLSGNVLKWKFTAGSAVISKPASSDNMIYLTSYNGTVYALDRNDGSLKWQQDMKTRIWSSPVLNNGIIYFGDRNGNINALDAQNGGVLWRYQTGYFVDSAPAFLNDTLYAASYDGKVYALNASTGELVWKSEQLYPIYASPVVERGSVFAGTLDGNLYELNRIDGRVEGLCAMNGTISTSPVIMNGIVYVGSQDGRVYGCKI
ncbi:Dolichyl-monophosphooligosaccharide--protein glycotransferase AglB [uncultured archaeon]|nr:Dolichyl-monophosphooligosaccharide--protein glycotransferase AglB [uncultured archaeon]